MESPFSNGRYGVGDSDGGQTAAAIESLASDARHAVGNGD